MYFFMMDLLKYLCQFSDSNAMSFQIKIETIQSEQKNDPDHDPIFPNLP